MRCSIEGRKGPLALPMSRSADAHVRALEGDSRRDRADVGVRAPGRFRLRQFRGSRCAGFTMVEIALCIGIIGFALVAIIGVLPTAMRVQQDNRADTIIDQDGNYWLEAIRHGAQGLDDLTNYVKIGRVRIVTNLPPSATFYTNWVNDPKDYDTGRQLIGLLSTLGTGPNQLRVEAEFRAISGAAVEKDPNSTVGFEYLLISEVVPFQADPAIWPMAFPTVDPNSVTNVALSLQNNLYELRLTFRWPLLPSGAVGGNKKVFRTLVSGYLLLDVPGTGQFPHYFFQPALFQKTQ